MCIDYKVFRCLCNNLVIQFQQTLLIIFQSLSVSSGQSCRHFCIYHTAPYTIIELKISASCRINLLNEFSISLDDIICKCFF